MGKATSPEAHSCLIRGARGRNGSFLLVSWMFGAGDIATLLPRANEVDTQETARRSWLVSLLYTVDKFLI